MRGLVWEEEQRRRVSEDSLCFPVAAWQRAHVGVWWECERGSVSFSCSRVFFSFSLGRDGLCALCGPDVYLWECRAAVARGVTHRSPAISAKPLIRHMTFSPGAASLSSAPPSPNHRPKTCPQILERSPMCLFPKAIRHCLRKRNPATYWGWGECVEGGGGA